jgi:secreted Zn-dependent insulinase-like peptidase
MSLYLDHKVWSNKEKLTALKQIKYTDLQEFIPELFSYGFVECFVHGNMSASEAKDIYSLVVCSVAVVLCCASFRFVSFRFVCLFVC